MPGAAAEVGPGSAVHGVGAAVEGVPGADQDAPGMTPAVAMTAAELARRFQLVQEVGRGSGGSAVFRALDARGELGGAVAVKRVPRLSAEGRAALQREVDLLHELRGHPKVVQYVGHGDAAGHLWVVMEYCEGGSVQDLLDVTPDGLREEQIAHVCREALEALAGLHAKGLLHRDVKPGNMLVTSAGHVKLGDLGAAQRAADASPGDWTAGPLWAAPEVLAIRPYGPPSDVWAIGIR